MLRREVSFHVAGILVIYRKGNEAVQGKTCYHSVEDLEAAIGIKPVVAPKGECHTCHGNQGRRVMHLDVDIGQGPSEDVYMIRFTAYKYALQRLGVLGSTGMSRNTRKKLL